MNKLCYLLYFQDIYNNMWRERNKTFFCLELQLDSNNDLQALVTELTLINNTVGKRSSKHFFDQSINQKYLLMFLKIQ